MRALATGDPAPGVVDCPEGPVGPGTVFVYSGRGSQWPGMGRQLLADEPAFAAAVAELEPTFVAEAGFSLHDVIATGKPLEGIEQIQLGVIGMQLALTALWRSYGVTPDLVIGHSMGEVAAAVVAGAITPAEGLRVTATRSRLMAPLSGQGTMATLELDADATEALIADHPQVTVGIYASPRQTVISGPTEQIDELIAKVRAQGQFAGKVNIEVAPHNPAMDALQPAMRSELAGLTPRPPTIPIISTTYEDVGSPRGIRRRALGHQHAQPGALPAGHYRGRGRSPHLHRDQRAPVVDPCHQRNPRRARTGGRRRSRLLEHRHPATRRARHPDLPHQPQPPHHPPTPDPAPVRTAPRAAHHPVAAHPALDRPHIAAHHTADTHPLLGIGVTDPTNGTRIWECELRPDLLWLGDHVIDDLCVLPGSAYAEVALAAATDAFAERGKRTGLDDSRAQPSPDAARHRRHRSRHHAHR